MTRLKAACSSATCPKRGSMRADAWCCMREAAMSEFKPCIAVPVYNHEHAICAVQAGLLRHDVPCILIDDGSDEACAVVLDALAREHAGRVDLVRLPRNQGKGAAVL